MKPVHVTLQMLISLIFLITYLAGVVLAKGFWSTLISGLLFPYAWYLVVERCMQALGIV